MDISGHFHLAGTHFSTLDSLNFFLCNSKFFVYILLHPERNLFFALSSSDPLWESGPLFLLSDHLFFGELFFDYPACTLNTNPSEPIHGSALITVIHPTNGVMIRQGQLTWASQHRFPRATSSRVSKIRPPSSVPLTPHDSLSKFLTTLARAHTHCCGCLDRHEKRHAIFFFCVNVSKFAALFKRESFNHSQIPPSLPVQQQNNPERKKKESKIKIRKKRLCQTHTHSQVCTHSYTRTHERRRRRRGKETRDRPMAERSNE